MQERAAKLTAGQANSQGADRHHLPLAGHADAARGRRARSAASRVSRSSMPPTPPASLSDIIKTTDKQRNPPRGAARISLWKNALISPDLRAATAEDDNEQHATPKSTTGLPGHPARLPGGGFRRPDPPAGRAVRARSGSCCEKWQQPAALPAGRRIPGHQRLPVPAAAAADRHARGAFTAVGDDDQAIYGWRGADIENLQHAARGLPAPARGQAGAELPLHHPHPARRQQPDRQQPQAVRKEPVERPRPRRPDQGDGRQGRRARGRKRW